MTHLLDVNAILALIWTSHVNHSQAKAWRPGKKLAVCPITELGFVRVSTGKNIGATMADARTALADFLSQEKPQFVPADARALDGAVPLSSGETTDLYLANLAVKHGMKLATFDQGISHPAVELIV